jgi:hypothetical protein
MLSSQSTTFLGNITHIITQTHILSLSLRHSMFVSSHHSYFVYSWYQNLWLLIGVSNSSFNALYIVQVSEFEIYDFQCRLPIDDSNLALGLVVRSVSLFYSFFMFTPSLLILFYRFSCIEMDRNVSGKCVVLPMNKCDSWKFWWDGVRCNPRPFDIINLSIQVSPH